MTGMENHAVRCAIYTRKSVEEGLEQEFNSLDAQRSTCESFIRAKMYEGWVCLPQHYDDGGFSGGNTNRPAFKQLMSDIEAGKIDMVVVYKIDRLSRSLYDFSDIFKTFEVHHCCFASVTQEFNTSTSMGRMVMNLLMTFAQFEREQTAERVRDKMRATRKQGLLPGGVTPYGYRRDNKRLVPDPATAAHVTRIFQLYRDLGSPRQVCRQLAQDGIWRDAEARKPWKTPNLAVVLRNPVYVGEVAYEGSTVQGKHAPILDRALWDDVQRMLAAVSVQPPEVRRKTVPALLGGIIRCGHCGASLSYMWTSKNKNGARKYGYYVCLTDSKRGVSLCPVKRVSAQMIEPIVEAEVMSFLKTPTMLQLIADELETPYANVWEVLNAPEAFWTHITPAQKRELFQLVLASVMVYDHSLDIRFRTGGNQKLIKEVQDGHGNS